MIKMLEWSARCQGCQAPIGGISLGPWAWWTRRFGKRCPACGTVTPAAEIERQARIRRIEQQQPCPTEGCIYLGGHGCECRIPT